MKKSRFPEDYYSDDRSQHGKNYAIFYGGTRGDVELKIKKYFDNWPREGYSTRVDIGPTWNREKRYWFARVERWNNCE